MLVTHDNMVADLVFPCGACPHRFSSLDEAKKHRKSHVSTANDDTLAGFVTMDTAHNRACESLRYMFHEDVHFITAAFVDLHPRLLQLLRIKRAQHKMMKVAIVMNIEFVKINEDGVIDTTIIVPFRATTFTLLPLQEIEPLILSSFDQIDATVNEFVQRGSGWAVNDLLFCDVEVVKCKPMQGGCGLHSAVHKRGGAGVKFTRQGFAGGKGHTDEEDCFYLALADYFYPNATIAQLRKYVRQTFVCSVSNPVKLSDIGQFEKDNWDACEMSINVVYKDEDDVLYPVHVSSYVSAQFQIVLMMCCVKSSRGGELHYSLLAEPTKLLANRRVDANGRVHTDAKYFCFNCCNYQCRKESYLRHVEWCHEKNSQKVIMPEVGDTVEFQNDRFDFKVGYMLFFDFETLQKTPERSCACKPTVSPEDEECTRLLTERVVQMLEEDTEARGCDDPEFAEATSTVHLRDKMCPHKTHILREHQAFCYSLVMVNREGEVVEEMKYIGDDAAEHFMTTLLDLEDKYLSYLKEGGEKMIPLTQMQELRFAQTELCWICQTRLDNDRVRDHDHITGEFISAAHNACNLARREPLKIITFAHNFSGYDSHLIVKELGKFSHRMTNLGAIPLNTQKFKILRFNNIIMLDSIAFLPDSLEKLVGTLTASNHAFPFMSRRWPRKEQRDVLLRKGIYPYGFATSIGRLKTTLELPEKSMFFNDIGDVSVKEADYQHACDVWSMFECKNMVEYTELYCAVDVYQLVEVITNLRNIIFDEFEIDMCHYFSLPMLAKDIMLKMTDVSMELIHDQEMSHMMQDNIRGGLSYINTRYWDVEDHRQHEENSLVYLDANNLYGHAMCFPLPLRDFRWMSPNELTKFDALRDVNKEVRIHLLDTMLTSKQLFYISRWAPDTFLRSPCATPRSCTFRTTLRL